MTDILGLDSLLAKAQAPTMRCEDCGGPIHWMLYPHSWACFDDGPWAALQSPAGHTWYAPTYHWITCRFRKAKHLLPKAP